MLGGLGLALVGANPDNLRVVPHSLGATLGIGGGNAGLIVLGLALRRDDTWRPWGTAALAVGVLGFVAVLPMNIFDDSVGLFERITVDPQILMYAALGIRVLLTRRAATAGGRSVPAPA